MTASPARPPAVDVRRADERFHTRIGWLDSRHSFSFSSHYDPANTHHGLLLVSNDDTVRAGTGFRTHPHQDMEIVTWVLDGELEHKDSEGHHGIIYPGLAQRMSAGTGIWHSEMNPRHDRDVHFVQMWVPPDTERIRPGYEQLDINAQLDAGGLVPIASGRGHAAAISVRQRGAVLWGGRLEARGGGHGSRRAVRPRLRGPGQRDAGGRGGPGGGRRRPPHRRRRARAHRGSRRGRRGAHLGDRRRAARRLTGRATDRTREPLVRRSQKRRRDGEVGRRAIARDRNLSDNRDVGLDQLIAAEGRSGARPPEARPAPAGARRWGRARQRPNTWSSRRALTAVASTDRRAAGPARSR